MPRGGVLSADLFHPDCECCGAPGDLNVIGNQTPRPGRWWCVQCESSFDVSPESPWYGVDELPSTTRGVYIDREIRGLPTQKVAQSRHVSSRAIPGLVGKAKKATDAARMAAVK